MPPRSASSVAATRAGTVARSLRVDTNGAITLSRSQPSLTEPAVRPTVKSPTASVASSPPSVETTRKSTRVIVPLRPNTVAVPLASTARTMLKPSDSAPAASRFPPTTPSGRKLRRNVPAWAAVPSRLPMAPNTLPRSATAPGTSSSSPGRSARVPSAAARTSPLRVAARTPTTSAASRWPASTQPGRRRRGPAGARRSEDMAPSVVDRRRAGGAFRRGRVGRALSGSPGSGPARPGPATRGARRPR
jgi:hypothetical protein